MAPFQLSVWIGLAAAIILISLVSSHGKNFGSELYFIISLILKEPIRTFSKTQMLFVLTMIVIATGYESIYVGKFTAPGKPPKFENAAQFLSQSHKNKIVLSVKGPKLRDQIILNGIKRHNMSNSSFIIVERNESDFTWSAELISRGYPDMHGFAAYTKRLKSPTEDRIMEVMLLKKRRGSILLKLSLITQLKLFPGFMLSATTSLLVVHNTFTWFTFISLFHLGF